MGRVMNLVLEDEDVLELMRILLETTPKPLWFGLGHIFRARQDTYSKTDRGRTAVILELRARGVAVQQHPSARAAATRLYRAHEPAHKLQAVGHRRRAAHVVAGRPVVDVGHLNARVGEARAGQARDEVSLLERPG